ncbi:uncharacterized protein LOC123895641 isoform X1 [Trifolium pratense]|uniref:uncharacterized protein LOC123895641 isoform X1 n=1 Tax=Trifolium pratense TaxID=57577 RepID=UPI001E694235|nr:uncharacterized protein LOC123895641 isoform X1 [Trifolium pratense]
MDRSWMYDRFNPHRKGLKLEFIRGVQEFISKAKEQPCFLSEKKIKCPCPTCMCVNSSTIREVKAHLYKSGFKPNYLIWTEHGELDQNINICVKSQSNNSGHMEEVEEEEDPKTPHMEESEENEDPKTPHMDESEENEDPKTSHMEESEEDEDPKTLQEIESCEQNADGKVLIRPCGSGWAPSSVPAAAIKHAIQSHFQGPFYRWSATPEDVREYWWKLFGDKVTWDPRDHGLIRKTFQTRGAKRLSDMLSKLRTKGTRPHWICEEAWKGLIDHWEGEAFKKISTQNKTNRASGKGGAVHTTGRKAHVDVALSMVCILFTLNALFIIIECVIFINLLICWFFMQARELGRPLDPDELFLATHKKKSGTWVDNRSQTTYKRYQDRLKEVQTQIGEASQNGTPEVDGATKIELWKEAAGGKSRGRCYGTAHFALNLQRGVTSLTQESREPYSGTCDHAMHLEAIDAARKEAVAARQEAATARQEAAEVKQQYQLLEEQLRKVMKRMKALERQSAGASSVSQAHRGYPHSDDDHSLDVVLSDRRRKKRLALRRHRHYDDDDHYLDEILAYRRRKQHRAQRARYHYDDDNSLDEILPKQRHAKRGHSHYDDSNSLDEGLPKKLLAKRGHPHFDDDDEDSSHEDLPKQRQAKKGHPHYDDDEDSLHEDLPKQRQAKRGHPRHDDHEQDSLHEDLPKQRQANRGHPHSDDKEDSLHEDLPKQRQAKKGHPHYDSDEDSLHEDLPKQRQAKRGHPHYVDDSLDEVLPKQPQSKRRNRHYDDDDSVDEVLPARRRRRYL